VLSKLKRAPYGPFHPYFNALAADKPIMCKICTVYRLFFLEILTYAYKQAVFRN